MAAGDHAAGTLRRYGEAQARLEHAGGWNWRDRAAAALRGLGFADAALDRPLDTFSGGELTRASLARALAGDPDLLLLDEPTNHLDVENLEWLERELVGLDAAVILVAHDRWFLEAVTTAVLELTPGGPQFFAGPVACLAARAGRARGGRSPRRRARRRRHRAAGAVRRAVPLQEVQGEAGAGQAHADRAARAGAVACGRNARVPDEAAAHARLRVPETGPDGTDRPRGGGRAVVGRRQAPARRRRARARARRARRARRPERVRKDDAAREPARPEGARRRTGAAGPRRRACVLLAARAGAAEGRLGARVRTPGHRPPAPAGPGAPGAFPLLRLGGAREAAFGALGRRAPAARAGPARRLGRQPARPRRADEPPRPREPRGARGGAGGVPRHGPARLARPRHAGRRARPARRGRGAAAALLRRRLGRSRAGAGGSSGGRLRLRL